LIRLNDDQNIRALFERALSSLPPEESVEVGLTSYFLVLLKEFPRALIVNKIKVMLYFLDQAHDARF